MSKKTASGKASVNFSRLTYYEFYDDGTVGSAPPRSSLIDHFAIEIWSGPEHPFDLPVLDTEGYIFPDNNFFASKCEGALESGAVPKAVCDASGKVKEEYLRPVIAQEGRVAALSSIYVRDGYWGTENLTRALRAILATLRAEYPELRGVFIDAGAAGESGGSRLKEEMEKAGYIPVGNTVVRG